jgi:hypothetical protein
MKVYKIDGVDYPVEQLNNEQILLANHIVDLERKLSSAQFNVDQMMVGRKAFLRLFEQSLTAKG